MWIYFVVIALITIFVYIIYAYNELTKLKNMVKEAFATMDIYLKKRWDLIPNLVETVKGYAKHEQNTLEKLTSTRGKSYELMSNNEKINTNENMGSDISRLMVIAEAYPELKASTNFLNLSSELTKVEEDIANSRNYYNGVVREYNTQVQIFPIVIIANIFNFKPEKMFEINDADRENIEVKV